MTAEQQRLEWLLEERERLILRVAALEAAAAERAVAPLLEALREAQPQLREVWNDHSRRMGFVFDCSCDLCYLGFVADMTPEQREARKLARRPLR